MSVSDEKAPKVPPPVEQPLHIAPWRRKPLQWLPYYMGAFAVLPFLERWLRPVLNFSLPVRRGLTLLIAFLAAFVMQAVVDRFRDPPDRPLPRDRDEPG